MVGVAGRFPNLPVGLLEQLLGMGSVAVHVPVIGALSGDEIIIRLVGEAFGLRQVRVAAPQVSVTVAIVVLRDGKPSGNTGEGEDGHPDELAWVHAIASVGHKVAEAAEGRVAKSG